jgi:hypothetical protein
LLETIAGEDPKNINAFRRHEDRAPPHLPLPPTLPYQPTSTPFRRHLQILEESLLSSSAEPSWEIFEALHEDLRRNHLPPDTLRAMLGKQVEGIAGAGKNQAWQWKKVAEILEILDGCGVLARAEDLERIIIAGIDEQGRRTAGKYLKADQLQSIWNSLVAIRSSHLHSISLSARERWLLFCISRAKRQRMGNHRGEIHHDLQSELRSEWRRLAPQGFFRGLAVSEQLLQAFHGDYLAHVKDIIETLRVVHQHGGTVPLDAVRFVWGNHLRKRVTSFEPPDPDVYRIIAATLSTDTPAPGSFDVLSRDALQQAISQVTGNVQETALSLFLPSDKITIHTDESRSFEQALHTTRRRIKHIPTQPTESQTPSVVNSLGFGALVVKASVVEGVDVPESVVTVIFRGFKYLPRRIRTDERYAARLTSALVLLVQALRQQDRTLKRWMGVWPVMLDAIAGYSTDRHGRVALQQTMFLYRLMRRRNLPEHGACLAGFRNDLFHKVLDFPWLALELYMDGVGHATEDAATTRAALVFRIATMSNQKHLRRIRNTIDGYITGEKSSTVRGIVRDAIGTCESPAHALSLYEMIKERDSSAEALSQLLAKMQELGDIGQQQQAVCLVEDAYSKGIRLEKDGLEMLVGLLDGQESEVDMKRRVEDVEEALRSQKRLFVGQGA